MNIYDLGIKTSLLVTELGESAVVDSLNSTDNQKLLSANQGKVLNDLIQNNINILNNLTNLSIKDLGEGIPPHLALREIIDDVKLNNTKKVQVFKYVDNEGSSTLGICIARLPNWGWIVYLMARKGIEKVVFDAAGNQDEWVPYGGTLEDELDISNDAKLKTLSLNAISIIINDLRTSIQNNTNAINTLTGIGDGSIKLIIDTILKSSDIVKCTYNELKTLIENKELIVGIKYRITDYVTTTSQADTKSANHQFDIIVEALTEDTLSEDAKVCLHDGNAYFSNNDLSAWEIKYCFENDTNRFTWASIIDGKGVIYYLKDEFNNECWYDFKNIQFLRTSDFFNTNSFLPYLEGDNYYFTFSNIVNNEIIDGTIYNENITVSIQNKIDKINGTKYSLNNTIFINDSSGYTRYNTIGFGNNNNTFGSKCQANTILQHCYNNVIGTMFRNNVIAQYFCNNKVSGQFEYNTLGIQCYNNSFSGHIWFTTFGSQFNYCSFNIPEDSTLEYCEFGSGIGFLNGIPAIRKVTFENNVAWYDSTTLVTNLQTIDGITLAEALTQDHDDQLYVYKAGDKYGVTSFSEMQNPEPVNIPTLVSNPGILNDNANNYGYVGTLQNIGVTGDIIVVDTITSYVRTGTASPNSTTPVWCRLLKYVNNAWTIVYQSIDSKIIGDYESGSEFSFKMERKVNDNLTPNDKIAIVYSSTDDITDTLNSTQLGFKCIKNKTGGLNNTLNDDSTGANNYQTALSINYLSMANTPINAVTIENAQTITGRKQFNNGLNISGKSLISSEIDSGELKVFPQGDNTTKGFIIRSANRGDTIPTVELLATNTQASYTYSFPKKDGTVAMLNDIVDNLTSTETNKALSANQGRILNEKIENKADNTEFQQVKQKQLQLTVKDNGNIILSNLNGQSQEFMPATPSGDPMHWAYVSAGAEYNDSGEDKVKDAPWAALADTDEEKKVTHKAGCWYLNGLGDITEEDMVKIYNAGKLIKQNYYNYKNLNIKTTLNVPFNGGETNGINLSGVYSGSKVQIIGINRISVYDTILYPSNLVSAFSGCTSLRIIIPTLKLTFCNNANYYRNTFYNCKALEYVKLESLNQSVSFAQSSIISKESILFSINKATPTSAITITLHPDAYTRLVDDTEIKTALETKNAALEGTGGSISLVSV